MKDERWKMKGDRRGRRDSCGVAGGGGEGDEKKGGFVHREGQ